MKNPNTGLYHFCLNIGFHLLRQQLPTDKISFFIPPKLSGIFGPDANYILKGFIHDLPIPFSKGYKFSVDSSAFDVWHMTHQSSRYSGGKAKTVLTVHDLNFLYDHPTARKKEKYLRIIQDRIDCADRIVCISNYCKEDVMKHLNTGAKPVDVIYNGCSFFAGNVQRDPPYKPASSFLFALGTILPKKNFHVLPSLLQRYAGELVIAGMDGHPYKNKILEEARRHHVSDRIKFIGTVNEEDKYWYYQHCEAFLFPSIAEGFGLPVIEAMQYGKPVFLSTHTSLPEVGGPHAYYFKNFDPEIMQEALINGLHDFEIHKKEIEIRNWAQQFTWGKTAADYWNVYRSLANV